MFCAPPERELFRRKISYNKSKTTVDTYLQNYDLVRKHIRDVDLYDFDEHDVDVMEIKWNNAGTLKNKLIPLLYCCNSILKEYVQCKLECLKDDIEGQSDVRNMIDMQNGLFFTKDDLFAHLQSCFDLQRHKAYVVNYCLLHYFVRNKDVNAKVVMPHAHMRTDENYFVLHTTFVEWIRNVYKTVRTYKPKSHRILCSRFLHCLQQLPLDKKLFNTDSEVKSVTLGEIGEARIYKSLVKDVQDNESNVLSMLNHMAKNRGSSLNQDRKSVV